MKNEFFQSESLVSPRGNQEHTNYINFLKEKAAAYEENIVSFYNCFKEVVNEKPSKVGRNTING